MWRDCVISVGCARRELAWRKLFFYGYNVPVVKDQDFFLAVSPSFFHTNMESVIRVFPPATNYPFLVRPLEPSQARTMALWRKTIHML